MFLTPRKAEVMKSEDIDLEAYNQLIIPHPYKGFKEQLSHFKRVLTHEEVRAILEKKGITEIGMLSKNSVLEHLGKGTLILQASWEFGLEEFQQMALITPETMEPVFITRIPLLSSIKSSRQETKAMLNELLIFFRNN